MTDLTNSTDLELAQLFQAAFAASEARYPKEKAIVEAHALMNTAGRRILSKEDAAAIGIEPHSGFQPEDGGSPKKPPTS